MYEDCIYVQGTYLFIYFFIYLFYSCFTTYRPKELSSDGTTTIGSVGRRHMHMGIECAEEDGSTTSGSEGKEGGCGFEYLQERKPRDQWDCESILRYIHVHVNMYTYSMCQKKLSVEKLKPPMVLNDQSLNCLRT